jgi:hypothetical protein
LRESYEIVERKGWVLDEILDRAVAALERELAGNA